MNDKILEKIIGILRKKAEEQRKYSSTAGGDAWEQGKADGIEEAIEVLEEERTETLPCDNCGERLKTSPVYMVRKVDSFKISWWDFCSNKCMMKYFSRGEER